MNIKTAFRKLMKPCEGMDYCSTKGFFKLRNALRKQANNLHFIEEALVIRKRYGIPEKGFVYPEDVLNDAQYDLLNEWYDKEIVGANKENQFIDEVQEFGAKHGFYCPQPHIDPVLNYIYYNRVLSTGGLIHGFDLVDLDDRKESIGFASYKRHKDGYPVALYISPYANLADIRDYITEVYKPFIEPMQKKYRKEGVLIGKVTTKDPKKDEIKAFILGNRSLGAKELSRLVGKNFGVVKGPSEIRDIISKEKV